MEYITSNAYYFRTITHIGGIQTHLYYIAKKYGKYDITIFCHEIDQRQLHRLRQYVRVVELKPGDTVICDNLFCCFNREILDQCEANHKYLVLHGDYEDIVRREQGFMKNLPIDPRIDKYLGVSQHVCDSWERLTGIHAEYIGEPVIVPKPKKPILLCSATRLSPEKGWERMKRLATGMASQGISFIWMVFTNSIKKEDVPGMVFLPARLDITEILPMFDAVVQLSDNEGFCLTVAEALLCGVPVITTDLPVFKELGLNDTNSVRLPFDMEDIPYDKIKALVKKKPKWKAPEDKWDEYLSHEPSWYEDDHSMVMATGEWVRMKLTDVELQHVPQAGEIWGVTPERLKKIREFEKYNKVTLIV